MAAMGALSTAGPVDHYSLGGGHQHPKAKSNDLMFMNSLYNPQVMKGYQGAPII